MPGMLYGAASLKTSKKHGQAVRVAFASYAWTCLKPCGWIWLCLQHELRWQVQSWLRPLQKMRCIWEHTPAAVRDELCSFAQAQSFEQAKSIAKKNQLVEFAKKLFVESNEAALVRPLCVLLGYLHNADQNYLHGRFSADELVRFEGSTGSLELLHACSGFPGLSKYQALFDTRAVLTAIAWPSS